MVLSVALAGLPAGMARAWRRHLQLPVGVVVAALGAKEIETWMSDSALPRTCAELPSIVAQSPAWDRDRDCPLEVIASETAEPDDNWLTELREAQGWASAVLTRVGTVCLIDLGANKDRHPRAKIPAGERGALRARWVAYGEAITATGLVFERLEIRDGLTIMHFTQTGGGLRTTASRPPTDFALAGADRQRHCGPSGSIAGDSVSLSHPAVPAPVEVRYDWSASRMASCAVPKPILPALPFRSDGWKLRSCDTWQAVADATTNSAPVK